MPRDDVPPSSMTVTLLGTGTSTGVPVIGCDCAVCQSDDPRDTRTRCACYLMVDGLGILIDTGPDFRTQALREGIERIDAVLYTHHHFDHVVGLDDLRPFFFRNRAPMPCYAAPNTATVLRRNYDYILGDDPYPGAPQILLHEVERPFRVHSRYGDEATARVVPLEVYHGDLMVYGYRIGRFAYLTDVSHIPEPTLTLLNDLDVLVLDALRPDSHPTHFSFEEAVAMARQIGARQTFFIHMTHKARHAEADAALPARINLGYDGLTFPVYDTSAADLVDKNEVGR